MSLNPLICLFGAFLSYLFFWYSVFSLTFLIVVNV